VQDKGKLNAIAIQLTIIKKTFSKITTENVKSQLEGLETAHCN
jgi:hypothetical protein